MITHITTHRGRLTLDFVAGKALGSPVQVLLYDQIAQKEIWPCGMYIFSDMERATPSMCEIASRLHKKLAEYPRQALLLNHPVDHLKRFELLRALYESGQNDFNVHRADEIVDSIRYPVFLRYTDQHIGPSSDLLHTQHEMEDKLAALIQEGHPIERLIAVEYVDTSDAEGVFMKFGALRVGSHVVPGHMFASTDWMLKHKQNQRWLARNMEIDFIREFPFREQVMAAFETANLQYGRIDYSVKDGRIQVWEINDNPTLGSSVRKRRWISRWQARSIARPKRRAAFQQELSVLNLQSAPMEFRVSPRAETLV